MGDIKTIRDALVTDLQVGVGVPVHPHWPIAFVAPCLFVLPPVADQYVQSGQRFGELYLAVDIVILAAHAPIEEALLAIEELIEATIANTMDWQLRGIESPAPTTVLDNGAEYLGTVVHLSKPFRLTPRE